MENLANKVLQSRHEVDPTFTWKLADLYSSIEEWERAYNRVPALMQAVVQYKGRILSSVVTFLESAEALNELGVILERLIAYAYMGRDQDQADPVFQGLADRAMALSVEVQAATSFITPEILAAPSEQVDHLLQDPRTQAYAQNIAEILRQKGHVLAAEQEELLANAEILGQGPQTIFSMLANADMKFPSVLDEHGDEVEVTHGRYISLLRNQDRKVRKEAFTAMYSTYDQLKNTFAATLGASVRNDVFFARAHHYPSALEAALAPDAVPLSVYDQLIQSVRQNLPKLHKYMAMRKRLLGVSELHMYDLYASIAPQIKEDLPYKRSVDLVVEMASVLGPAYQEEVRKGLSANAGWVDVYENRGKRSGAYSWGAYGVHPYMLLNYENGVDGLFTLSHEMGHSMHTFYSQKEQPYHYAHYRIFVAEVASTCHEALLMHDLLQKWHDPKRRLFLLNHYLDQFRGTIFRQTMFAEFEKITHAAVENGQPLTPQYLNEVYHGLNVDYQGADVVVDPLIDLEWARIPHFYNAFYVYKYATGFSAAVALSQQILEEGEPAVERYLQFLKSGSSQDPLVLLQRAGVDLTTPEPVHKALNLFGRLTDEMDELSQ